MKRLTSKTTNSGAIRVLLEPEYQEIYKKNLFTVLRKFSTSRKTRAVHKLIDKNAVFLAIFSGDASNRLTASILKETILRGILLNIYMYDDSLERHGSVTKATKIMDLEKKISQESTFVNEQRIHKIEELQKQKKELSEKFLSELDYMKMVDGIYFAWLIALATVVIEHDNSAKPKIITVASDILASILKKMYTMSPRGRLETEEHQLIEAIAIYFIRMYFYGESSIYALNLLKKAFDEEIIDSIKRSKVTKFDHFNDLAKILSATEILPMTPETFDLNMRRFFGKYAYEEYIQENLADFLAVMANLAAPSSLFKDAYPVDQELHRRLEELLLNVQKRVNIQPIES